MRYDGGLINGMVHNRRANDDGLQSSSRTSDELGYLRFDFMLH
jgi:hypothetical protein